MMTKRILLLGLLVALGVLVSAPAMAALEVFGTVAGVDAGADTALGSSVGYRVWSLSQSCPGTTFGCINCNDGGGGCNNIRCVPGFDGSIAGGGGYPDYNENTTAYGGDADNQTFFILWDGQVNGGAANHIAYYAVQGLIATNATVNPPFQGGDPTQPNCPGDPIINCFEQADNRFSRQTPLLSAKHGYPSGNSISSIGGLSPVPNVRVGNPGVAGPIPLSWDLPDTFSGAMKPGPTGQPAPASPVRGVRVYVCRNQPCSGGGPLANDACWTPLVSVDNPTNSASDATCPASGSCNWYALTVRVTGPGGGAMELETGREANTAAPNSSGTLKFVGVNSQPTACGQTAVLISSVSARYAGRGNVNVNWTTALEGQVSGFYVSRASTSTGPFTRVSPLLSPTGDNSTYLYTDKARTGVDRVIYYQIEALVGDSVVSSGPTAVTIQKGNTR